MSILIAPLIVAYKSFLDWTEIDVTVYDDTPDDIIVLTPMLGPGQFGQYPYYIRDGVPLRIPKLLAPPTLNLVGQKADTTKVYIALNVDLANDVVLEVYAVDESGASGGGGNGAQAHVAGTVTIDGSPAARDVLVIKDDPAGRQVIAEGKSEADGSFDIEYSGWSGGVIALAIDKYGIAFVPNGLVNAGTIIHPSSPNGYVYEVTAAGTLGESEPTWSTDSTVQSGGVTLNPRPYYRPIASGPIMGEVADFDPTYPVFVGGLEFDTSAARNFVTRVLPVDITAGDIIIAYGMMRAAIDTPAGFTAVPLPSPSEDASFDSWPFLFYKTATGAEKGTALTVSYSSGSVTERMSLNVAVVRSAQEAPLQVTHIKSERQPLGSIMSRPFTVTNINTPSLLFCATARIYTQIDGVSYFEITSGNVTLAASNNQFPVSSDGLRSVGFYVEADPLQLIEATAEVESLGTNESRGDIWIAIHEVE